jgi:hypothetical protein
VLFITNPRLQYKIITKLRERGIPYQVPLNTEYHCKSTELLITDEKGKDQVIGGCDKVVINNAGEDTYHRILLESLGKKLYKTIIVGIDPGKINAFVVLGDGQLIDKGKASVEELLSKMAKVSKIPHEKMIIRVGLARGNEEKALDLAYILSNNTDSIIELVEESRTSREKWFMVSKDRDINASYMIALKQMGVYEHDRAGKNRDRG